MKRSRRHVLTCLILILPLAGCMLFESRATRAMHASPDYKAGYSDGCASAGSYDASHRSDGNIRDDSAYAANRAYRTGWGAGFGACRNIGASAGPLQNMGNP